jgi:hypothetical protein
VPWDSAPDNVLNDSSDSTYGYASTNASGDYDEIYELSNTPADFASIDIGTNPVTWELRYQSEFSDSNMTLSQLAVRVMSADGATTLAAVDSSGGFHTIIPNPNPLVVTTTGPRDFAYVNTSATKSDWDSARIEIRIRKFRQKGGATLQHRVVEVWINGTYTTAAPPSEGMVDPFGMSGFFGG